MNDVEIVELADRTVMGSQERIEPMDADYNALWRAGFDPYVDEIAALASEPGTYGLYYGTETPGWVEFVMGMVVPEWTESLPGLVTRPLPGGIYARFRCTRRTIGDTWRAIYGQWLPNSGYRDDPTRPDFEYFPPEGTSPDDMVELYQPLREE